MQMEELIREVEGVTWEAILMCESRKKRNEMWTAHGYQPRKTQTRGENLAATKVGEIFFVKLRNM